MHTEEGDASAQRTKWGSNSACPKSGIPYVRVIKFLKNLEDLSKL